MMNRNDGYLGNWCPEYEQVEPDKFTSAWPLKLPKAKSTTMTVKLMEGYYFWTCQSCKEVMRTEKMLRPDHICK